MTLPFPVMPPWLRSAIVLKAVVVSGYAHGDRIKMALRLGASEYIRKPLNLKSVASAVRKAVDKERKAVAPV